VSLAASHFFFRMWIKLETFIQLSLCSNIKAGMSKDEFITSCNACKNFSTDALLDWFLSNSVKSSAVEKIQTRVVLFDPSNQQISRRNSSLPHIFGLRSSWGGNGWQSSPVEPTVIERIRRRLDKVTSFNPTLSVVYSIVAKLFMAGK
jgi:hypothetical protein